jgi:hypothetical protein
VDGVRARNGDTAAFARANPLSVSRLRRRHHRDVSLREDTTVADPTAGAGSARHTQAHSGGVPSTISSRSFT